MSDSIIIMQRNANNETSTILEGEDREEVKRAVRAITSTEFTLDSA